MSDGVLSPTDLILRAVDKGVTHLAITDHDTLDAYNELPDPWPSALTLIPGVEFSTRWTKIGIHIVGLNIDPNHPVLLRGVETQQQLRAKRARTIAERLQKSGLPDLLTAATKIAGSSTIGRPHFARCLVQQGHCKDMATAFRKYLGNGKPGDVRNLWPPINEVIDWITESGGTAVLAHPARYKLTATKLRELVRDFSDAGGEAIEVISGSQRPEVTKKLAELSNDHGLSASCGSDFHCPDNRWSDLGQFPALPADIAPVWEQWKTTPQSG